MAEKLTETAVCPVCRKSVEINSAQAKCPVCGHASSAEMFSKTKEKLNAENDAELYRLMATADAFFSKKNYDEAYVVYSSVLEIDRNYLKAYFRRELTSQYLMLKTSSVYLSNDSFFMKLDEVKERFFQLDINDKEARKLKMTMCRDMIEYIAVRAEYEKKYASAHKNVKTVEVYMSNMILLFEYSAEVTRYLDENFDENYGKERAHLIIECCSLGMKIKGMLLAGAEYIETVEKLEDFSGEQTAKNVSRIKRRMLTQDEVLRVETVAGNMEKTKEKIVSGAQGELYDELNGAKKKSEETVKKELRENDEKRAEYEQWRRKNEQEYFAADKKILIFSITGKAAVIFAVIMALVFFFELFARDAFMEEILILAVLFIGAGIAFNFLKKSMEKKKGFYARVIEGDSAQIRTNGGNFRE